ncbi:unnamed protein product, partial [Ilex paraguariensis]
ECRRNHAAHLGRHIVDGCGGFLKNGNNGTPEALLCAVCGCHRNFHRKEELPLRRRQAVRLYFFHHLAVAAAAAAPPPPPHYGGPIVVRSEELGDGEIED